MLRLCISIAFLAAATFAADKYPCRNPIFSVKPGWPKQGIFKTLEVRHAQNCIAACKADATCTVAAYDFDSMDCALATGSYGDCNKPDFSSVDNDMLDYMRGESSVTFGCIRCWNDAGPQADRARAYVNTYIPRNPKPSVLSAQEQQDIKTKFAQPQCTVSKMANVQVSAEQWNGRWWGVLVGGKKQANIKAQLLDNSVQTAPSSDGSNLIVREVTKYAKGCREDYFSWQVAEINGQHLWQKTVNYTVDYNVLRWADQGNTHSFFYRVLWTNGDIVVQYACFAALPNGKCADNQGAIFVYSRSQGNLQGADVDVLKSFLKYACVSGDAQTLNTQDSCVADYVNRTELYWVREECDYTDVNFMAAHSEPASYESLNENPNWAGVGGTFYGAVTQILYQQPWISQHKMYVPMNRQLNESNSSCTVYRTTAWSINETAGIPDFFPTKNLWVQTEHVDDNITSPTNTFFWRNSHDGLIAATISCVGSAPCRNASAAFNGGSRRYRKLSIFYFRVKAYPLAARACIDPTKGTNNKAVRPPQLLCKADADPKSCLVSDDDKYIFSQYGNTNLAGTWNLARVLSIHPTDAKACRFTKQGNNYDLSCFIKRVGTCAGPYKGSLKALDKPGKFSLQFTDPVLGNVSETLIVLYRSDKVLALYGCAGNGVDMDGSCRDERMIAYTYVKPGYSLSAADNAKLYQVYNNVCLWATGYLHPVNANDACNQKLAASGNDKAYDKTDDVNNDAAEQPNV